MSSGITDQMRAFTRQKSYRRTVFVPVVRDRSLAGKARIRARRAANRPSR
jgi:hypothetical protein